jgi:hypothetical protein
VLVTCYGLRMTSTPVPPIDVIERLGQRLDAGLLHRSEAVMQLREVLDVTVAGAADLLDNWETARARYDAIGKSRTADTPLTLDEAFAWLRSNAGESPETTAVRLVVDEVDRLRAVEQRARFAVVDPNSDEATRAVGRAILGLEPQA